MTFIKYPTTQQMAQIQADEVRARDARTAAQLAAAPRTYTSERSRTEHQKVLKELAKAEAAEQLKREAPFKKLEAEFQASVNALARMERANLLILRILSSSQRRPPVASQTGEEP